ncbi:MAG: metal-dependent transcriptional regulator [Clostridia bacterium]|nr:metal-dependent transcriptional regulator [Clostridia bacterium]
MQMSESREMYLETILILSRTHPNIHAIDICEYMDFSRPSVSRALKQLKEAGLIDVDGNNHVTLTPQGEKIAQTVYERHTVLTKALMFLGVEKEVAQEDACRMEHVISPESFEAIKRKMNG